MNRREFLRVAGLGGVAAATLPWWDRVERTVRGADGATPQTLPNFVIILIDDMGYGDIEPFGSKLNRTPNLNRMAAEGIKLTSFYACPVCTPSRAELLTGCYAKRVGMAAVIQPLCPTGLNPTEKTIATLLKARGYATMMVGKWHLGDQPEFLPTKHGFDHYLGLPYSHDMGGTPNGKTPPLPLIRDAGVIEAPPDLEKLTALYTEESVKFIKASAGKPFFLYLPHSAVHVPIKPGKAFQGKSANGRYGDWVEEVDWSVGRILDTLRELKLEENTMVLFTSDNGPWLGRGKDAGTGGPLYGGKGSTWEGGMREPTIAWWPGKIAKGAVCDVVAGEVDVMPTLVKLAGGEVPADRIIDGRDLWPVLSGKSQEAPRPAHYYFNDGRLEAVRSGAWKLAIVPQSLGMGQKPATRPAGPYSPRLYNLDKDIGEKTDVAAEHPDEVKRLQELVAAVAGDLSLAGRGKGCRAPGRVENPQGLRKRVGTEYD